MIEEMGLPTVVFENREYGCNRVGKTIVWCITLATRPHPNLEILLDSCRRKNVRIGVLGLGDGRRMGSGRGFGLKLDYLDRFCRTLVENKRGKDLVLYVDGYDVFFCSGLGSVVRAYRSYGSDVVFSGEPRTLLNLRNRIHYSRVRGKCSGPYPHLCAGIFAGTARALSGFCSLEPFSVRTDDQAWWIRMYGSVMNRNRRGHSPDAPGSIAVDRYGRMATNMWATGDSVVWDPRARRYYDVNSGRYPPLLHFDCSWKKAMPSYYDLCVSGPARDASGKGGGGQDVSAVSLRDVYHKTVLALLVLGLLSVLFVRLCGSKRSDRQ